MSYSDMDKKVDGLLGKKAFSTSEKSFTMSSKTNNGMALKATTSMKGGSTTCKLNSKFKHSSGVNFSKIDIVSDGSVKVEANCASGVDNVNITSAFTMGTAKWLAGKKNSEKAAIGFEFAQGDLSASADFDFLAKNGDNDVVCFTPEFCYTMDNFQFGGDAEVNFPSPFGGDGGATSFNDYNVGLAYKTSDTDMVLQVGQPGKDNMLSASIFNNASADTKWGATFSQGKGASMKDRAFNVKVGAEFQNNADMSTKIQIDQNAVGSFKLTQALNGGASLTLQTEIDFNNLQNDAKFGLGFDMKL